VTLKRWIEILFLRFYAANLTRSRRGEPAQACRDAINQLSAVAGLMIIILIIAVALIVSPSWLQHMYDKDAEFLVILLAPGIAFAIWTKRAFWKFSETPESADGYKSPSAVRLTNMLYFAVPLALLLLVGVALRIFDPT